MQQGKTRISVMISRPSVQELVEAIEDLGRTVEELKRDARKIKEREDADAYTITYNCVEGVT